MTVRAKFRVTSIELFESPKGSGNVKLTAGNDKEGDNTDWSKWTPNGQIQLCITNPDAFKFFMGAMDTGTRIYVNFDLVQPIGVPAE